MLQFLRLWLRQFWQPLLLFSLGVVGTYFTYRFVDQQLESERLANFEDNRDHFLRPFHYRLDRYLSSLSQAQAFLTVDADINLQDFHDYFSSLDLLKRSPGLQSFVYSPKVKKEDFPRHYAKKQTERAFYGIWPKSENQVSFPILYIEPFDWKNQRALGFDLYTEAIRREAMDEARDTGQPTMTRALHLVQDSSSEPQSSFIILMPIYRRGISLNSVANRRKALQGYVSAAFRSVDLIQSILDSGISNVKLQVSLGDENQEDLVFDSRGSKEASASGFSTVHQFKFAGKNWKVFVFPPESQAALLSQYFAFLVLLGGLLISLLFARLIHIQASRLSEARKFSFKEKESRQHALLAKRSAETSERKMRLVSDTLPSLIAFVDRDQKCVFANKTYERWFGISPELIEDKAFQEILGEEAWNEVKDRVGAALKGIPQNFESSLRLGNETRHIFASFTPDIDQDGEVRGFAVLVNDFTAHRETEIKLRESQTRYKDLIESTNVIAWEADFDTGACTYVSPQIEKVLGYPANSWLQPNFWLNHIHEEDRDRILRTRSQFQKTPMNCEREYRLVAASGNPVWVRDIVAVYEKEGRYCLSGYLIEISDRKLLEERLRNLVNYAPMIIWSIDEDGVINLSEGRALERIGYKSGELVGVSVFDLYANQPDILANLRKALGGEEFMIEGKTGSARFETYFIPIRCNDQVKGVFGISVDVTDRQLSSETLRLQSKVLESMNEGVSLSDENGFILYTNPAEDRMFGYKPGELVGKHHTSQNIYEPERNLKLFNEVQEAIRQNGYWSGEIENIRKDKSCFTTFARITGVEISGKNCFVCVQQDISDQKLAEKALKESEEKFRLVTEAIPQVVWTASPDGHMKYFNRMWNLIVGSPASKDKNWQTVLHPDDTDGFQKQWQHSLASGEPFETEYRCFDARYQTYRWHLGRAIPLRDFTNKIIKWFGSSTDIEDQKRSQESLLMTVKLRDEFISIASHELKTPITSLKLQTQMLRRRFETDQSTVSLERMSKIIFDSERQFNRLTKLVEDMLDVSKISSGQLVLQNEVFDLSELMEECLNRFHDQLRLAHCKLIKNLRSNSFIYADRFRIEQVLSNLLTNAMKYGAHKPILVRVVRIEDEIEFSIKDHGIGIAPENHQRIFERFERAVSTKDISGLGLGLYISRRILDLHHAKISLESSLGEGAQFFVRIPAFKEDAHHQKTSFA